MRTILTYCTEILKLDCSFNFLTYFLQFECPFYGALLAGFLQWNGSDNEYSNVDLAIVFTIINHISAMCAYVLFKNLFKKTKRVDPDQLASDQSISKMKLHRVEAL